MAHSLKEGQETQLNLNEGRKLPKLKIHTHEALGQAAIYPSPPPKSLPVGSRGRVKGLCPCKLKLFIIQILFYAIS